MNRNCQFCGKPISGRIDKKFCDDTCRNNYNNSAGRNVNNLIRRINRKLTANRRILKDLNPAGTSTTTVTILKAKGYQFNYFTEILETVEGQRYYYCYEYGFTYLDDHHIRLIIRKEYVNQIE